MTKRMMAAILVWALCSLPLLRAEVIPGRWEKVDRLHPGSALVVQLKAGDRIEGAYKTSNPDELILTVPSGKEQRFLKNGVATILRPEVKSNKPQLIGAGIGAGAGVAVGVGVAHSFDETILARPEFQGLVFGCIGALVGALVGNALAKPRDEVLYRAVN